MCSSSIESAVISSSVNSLLTRGSVFDMKVGFPDPTCLQIVICVVFKLFCVVFSVKCVISTLSYCALCGL